MKYEKKSINFASGLRLIQFILIALGRQKNYPVLEHVLITDIGAEGKALARVNDMVVFVPHAIPGDIVDIQIIKKRRTYAEGRVVAFHQPSKDRIAPVCSHFGTCGGCKWQDLPYALQLYHKEKQVSDQLIRLGRLDIPGVHPILASGETYRYRNKLEFTFSEKRWLTREEMESSVVQDSGALGFHIPGAFDKILDIEHCYLQEELSDKIRLEIKRYALQHGMPFFHLRNHTGWLRTLVIRTASSGECMVILTFFYEDENLRERLLHHVADTFPEIVSLMYAINPKPHDSFSDLPVHCFRGQEYIMEQMEDLVFKIGPKSFFQTNSAQALALYRVVRDLCGLTGKETVYDLYTGTGTIANFVATRASKVVGIEYVPEAIEDAKQNAALNKLTNTVFYAGDMKDILSEELIRKEGFPDVMILDPPRAGVHPRVIERIVFASPRVLVYVSCNPATQARDLALLSPTYRITNVQPVDMFPQTHHVESVVSLEKRDLL